MKTKNIAKGKENKNWSKINKEACDNATLLDMSGWYELD